MDTGVYELDPQGRRCFRPAVPRFPALEDILDVLEPASAAIREFDRALSAWERPGLVGRLFARLDAVHSSGAEGSTTTFSELMEYQTSLHRAPDPADAAAVAACAEAIEEEPHEDPVAATLAIHRRLFAQARDPMVTETAGRLKLRANGTADPDAPGGFFYYAQPASVPAALEAWRTFTLASDPRTPEIVRQTLSHWMFEHIHPVADGNGRIGRLLVPLMLRQKGTTHAACAFFGEAVHEEKALYVEALRAARVTGDMGPWARLMLSFLDRTAAANLSRLDPPRGCRRRMASHRRGVPRRQHGARARPLRADAAGLHGARRARCGRRYVRQREHGGDAARRGGGADDQQWGAARPAVSGGGGAGDFRSVSGGEGAR